MVGFYYKKTSAVDCFQMYDWNCLIIKTVNPFYQPRENDLNT